MRQVAQFTLLFSLLALVSGCSSLDPTRLWKWNRGEDYMNNDQHFSVPAQMPLSTPMATDASSPN